MFLLPRPSMNTSNSAYLMAAEQEANESQDDGKVDKWHHSYSFYYPAATPLSPQSLLSPSMDLPGLVHTEKKNCAHMQLCTHCLGKNGGCSRRIRALPLQAVAGREFRQQEIWGHPVKNRISGCLKKSVLDSWHELLTSLDIPQMWCYD